MYIIANHVLHKNVQNSQLFFFYNGSHKKLLLNIHPQSVRNLIISIIANLREIHKLGKFPGCWKDKLRTTADGNV